MASTKTKKTDTKETIATSAQIERLNKLMTNQLSLPRVFVRGVIGGVGSALGATIVFGLLVALIAWAVVTLVNVPVVGNYIDQDYVNEQLQLETPNVENL